MPVGRSQMRKTVKKLGRVWKRETVCGERFDLRARCQLCFSRSARCAAEKRAHHLGTPDARRNAVEARRTIIPRGTKDPRLAVTSAQLGRDAVPGRARVSHAGRPRDFRSFARRHRCYHLSWVASAPSVDRSAREEVRACAETRARGGFDATHVNVRMADHEPRSGPRRSGPAPGGMRPRPRSRPRRPTSGVTRRTLASAVLVALLALASVTPAAPQDDIDFVIAVPPPSPEPPAPPTTTPAEPSPPPRAEPAV